MNIFEFGTSKAVLSYERSYDFTLLIACFQHRKTFGLGLPHKFRIYEKHLRRYRKWEGQIVHSLYLLNKFSLMKITVLNQKLAEK